MRKNSKYIHAGVHPDPSTGAIMTPIYQTSTFVQSSPGDHQGYEYARTGNPTRKALENAIAELEGAKYGLCFGSGLAAMDTALKLLKSGDEVIACNDLYGGSYRILTKVFSHFGIKSHFVDMSDLSKVKEMINSDTAMLWIETPTNPLLKLVDIQAITDIGKEHKLISVVDNTFASPHLQTPMALGADIVLHSATKYLGGHSDVVLGALVCDDADLAEKLYFLQNSCGAVCGPMDSFLVLRGLKTLHVRIDRACENAMKIAKHLVDHKDVSRVLYPGLEDNPYYSLAVEQMTGFGGMISFDLADESMATAHKVVSETKIWSLAESLGGVESLIGHPASMTHGAIPREERMAAGLMDGTIRLSVGIEDVEDLIHDLDMAISSLRR